MAAATSLKEIEAEAKAHVAAPAVAESDEWVSWPEDESPLFDAADLIGNLRKERPAKSQRSEPVAVSPDPEASEAADDLPAYLTATPAPAVGVIGYASADALANALHEFAGTGVHGGSQGRDEHRATVLTVDREPNGRFLLTVDGPRYVHPSHYIGTAPAEWLTAELVGLRATTALPLLLVVSEATGLSLDDLAPIAVEATCLVAALERRADLVAPVWEPRLLAAKPTPVPEAAPEPRKPSAVARAAQAKGGLVAWLARVPELVQGWPEAIPGPNGQRIAVRYGQRDGYGREYVALSATMENPAWGQVPMELELAPGVKVDLADVRVYI